MTNIPAAVAEGTPKRTHKVVAPFIEIAFQHGAPDKVGLNGCRVEDVIEVLAAKIGEYQSGPLACIENAEALHYMDLAREALLRRRRLRQDQGVINTTSPHESLFDNRTEDEVDDFSATGA